MMHSYLASLQKGLNKNKQSFLDINKITQNELQQMHAEKRFTEFVSKAELKQFEVRGYEMMLARILDAPIQASKKSNNEELQNKLQVIKNQLFSKPLSNQKAIEFKEDKPKSLLQVQQEHLENLRREAMSDNEEEECEESFYDDEEDEA